MIRKPSFLERLTGSTTVDDFEDVEEAADVEQQADGDSWNDQGLEPEADGELPVDMYHTPEKIVIRALIAGVNPENLDIAITRDMVTIKGHREEDREAPEEDYYHHELYWGGFSRTILLPEEVIIDEAEAKEKHGMLTIVLPKLDKARSARLKVKSHQIKP
jgi:HSP20 family molecular chaperone IbpA